MGMIVDMVHSVVNPRSEGTQAEACTGPVENQIWFTRDCRFRQESIEKISVYGMLRSSTRPTNKW